jgi:hypothetical protein
MVKMLGRSILVTTAVLVVTLVLRSPLHLGDDLSDLGGLGSFVTAFGTLYGVIIGFVVVEVWSQNIATQNLIDREAKDIEGLFQLTVYFGSQQAGSVNQKILDYLNAVLEDRFEKLAQGERNRLAEKTFQSIHQAIRNIGISDDREGIVLDHVIDQYLDLRVTRTERISQGLNRLPNPLKVFLYMASFLTISTFVLMPFANALFSLLAVGILTLLISFVHQLIDDLDNPFVGYWNVSPNLFEIVKMMIDKSATENHDEFSGVLQD